MQYASRKRLMGHIARIHDVIQLINEGDYKRDYNYMSLEEQQ